VLKKGFGRVMAMSASISLRQSQSLVMTPQLMQSIQLLQMTHFELVQFISQEVEKNPLLEFEANGSSSSSDRHKDDEFYATNEESDLAPSVSASEREDWYKDETSSLGDHLDTSFENVYDDGAVQQSASPDLPGQWHDAAISSSAEAYDLDDFIAAKIGLREHLTQQISLSLSNSAELAIALQFLEALDETGYLDPSALLEIAERLGVAEVAVETVLSKLQALDPPGIFARSLKECLEIQLRQRDAMTPAVAIVLDNLGLLAKRDFTNLRKLCSSSESDVMAMLSLIRTLNPRPAAGYDVDVVETAVPDVFVKQLDNGDWTVELNPATLPKVLVNESYFAKVSRSKTGSEADKSFMSECLQSAHWLTRSLDQRAKTMVKVTSEIVRQQQAFFEQGVDHLRPLNLKTVADAIKMHESTVSRVTSKKYMMTPRGLFELKYFFTSSIGAVEGGDAHSAEAVRHRIAKMIAQENPNSILSDDDIVTALRDTGIEIARRTVAKYREALGFGSSVQRRREKRTGA
jgi:RNA polymerase sigma-54 factor